jgi:glycosyltransferase involved in cell wall biosynthesis
MNFSAWNTRHGGILLFGKARSSTQCWLYIGNWNIHRRHCADTRGERSSRACAGLDHILVIGGEREGFPTSSEVELPEQLRSEIIFTRNLADGLLPTLCAGSDAFVFTLLHEGFGLPPLEAMACGVPTVVSNRASMPEVVAEASLVVDPSDARQFASTIYNVANDSALRPELIEAGHLRVRKSNWDATIDSHIDIYSRALHSRPVQDPSH